MYFCRAKPEPSIGELEPLNTGCSELGWTQCRTCKAYEQAKLPPRYPVPAIRTEVVFWTIVDQWFVSDNHFFHANILKFTKEDETRKELIWLA